MKNQEGTRPDRIKALVVPRQPKAVTKTNILDQRDGLKRNASEMMDRRPIKLTRNRSDRTEHDGSDHLL